ncbi:HNH/ENDO VII family nuclease [Pedobacter sp. Leaf132]
MEIDGKSVNLHHMIQIDGAAMSEITETFHKELATAL